VRLWSPRRLRPEKHNSCSVVEEFILFRIAVLIVHCLILGLWYGSTGTLWLVAAILPVMRILGIFGFHLERHVFAPEREAKTSLGGTSTGEIRGEPASVARLVILGMINYVELIVSFGIVYAAGCRACPEFVSFSGTLKPETVRDYVYFSGVTQLTIGYGEYSPHGLTRLFAMLQALIGLNVTMFSFARFVSYSKRSSVTPVAPAAITSPSVTFRLPRASSAAILQ
jgi:Ion channel